MKSLLLAIDIGTTGSKILAIDEAWEINQLYTREVLKQYVI